jgi:quercetin dioxygenase-like cupin family protein
MIVEMFRRSRGTTLQDQEVSLPERNELQHTSFNSMPVEHLNPLLSRQMVWGERGMLARIILRKGAIVPRHSHENEQISYILEGALRFTLGDGRVVTVSAGEVLVIPSSLPHQAEALEDTVDLDVFCPPRADWIAGADAYLRT